jgi:hypothetical protein
MAAKNKTTDEPRDQQPPHPSINPDFEAARDGKRHANCRQKRIRYA